MENNNENNFKFKKGDLVTCAFYGDEVFEIKQRISWKYCLYIEKDDRPIGFTVYGKYQEEHTHPSIKLVNRPEEYEEVTWHRVYSHKKTSDRPNYSSALYKSTEDFFKYASTYPEDFHWVKLEPVYTHKYKKGEV